MTYGVTHGAVQKILLYWTAELSACQSWELVVVIVHICSISSYILFIVYFDITMFQTFEYWISWILTGTKYWSWVIKAVSFRLGDNDNMLY